ncbi:DMT family transporter [Aestuariibacter salexigens]|uniref:DMT family transporter n=1 Tax=Aestuariibacter salexigens TaxID=226010 RepID=UPI0003F532FA|nr:DMT family transporter [Aestuariibacter salexigens]
MSGLQENPPQSGFLLVIAGTVLFSSKAILIKFLYYYDISPLELQALRMLAVAPCYALILGWLIWQSGWPAISKRELLGCTLAGIACYHIASYLDFVGLVYISAGLERIILFCYPLIAILFGKWFLKESLPSNVWYALAASYAGIILFFYADSLFGGQQLLFGSLLVFAASVLTAWYMVANQQYSRRFGSQRFTCLAMLAACASLLCHAFVVESVTISQFTGEVYWGAAALALFCTLIPSFLVSAGVRRIGASRAGVVGTVGPLFTVVVSNIMLDEPVTGTHLAGLLLVLTGMWLLRQGRRD